MDNSNINNQNPPQSPPVVAPAPVSQPVVPASPSVVANAQFKPEENSLPFWFYILFALVSIIFFFVTFLLGKALIDKNQPESSQNTLPNINAQVTPVLSPVPSVAATPTDDYVNRTEQIGDSDEITEIESDLDQTATGELSEDIEKLDTALNP